MHISVTAQSATGNWWHMYCWGKPIVRHKTVRTLYHISTVRDSAVQCKSSAVLMGSVKVPSNDDQNYDVPTQLGTST